MKQNVSLKDLRSKKLVICVPAYGGNISGFFMRSMLDLVRVLTKYEIPFETRFLFNESLVQRARNYLADEFWRCEGATHMIFIDSDIEFEPNSVLEMLAYDLDVFVALYPKKTINWNRVRDAVLAGIPTDKLERVIGDFVFNCSTNKEIKIIDPTEIDEAGTGFMMIKKEAFQLMRDNYPEIKYRPDHNGMKHFSHENEIYAFFDCFIHPETKRYLSEDYGFCYRWKKIGGKIFLAPWIKLNHIGTYRFVGDLQEVANTADRLNKLNAEKALQDAKNNP